MPTFLPPLDSYFRAPERRQVRVQISTLQVLTQLHSEPAAIGIYELPGG
jgi:hypothetical protein